MNSTEYVCIGLLSNYYFETKLNCGLLRKVVNKEICVLNHREYLLNGLSVADLYGKF